MRVYKLPLPPNPSADCDNCREMPARIRLVIGGHPGEALCAACIGVMSMEIGAMLAELLDEVH